MRLVTAVLLVAVVFPAVLPAAGAAADPAPRIDPDSVLIRVDVTADADAVWRFEHRVLLENDTDVAAFEARMAAIENGTRDEDRFRARMTRTVRAAENATGREMAVRNVSVRARIRELPQRYGVVVYRFRWVGFAAREGDRLVVGDALGGLFLNDETRLLVTWPGGYRLASVSPPPDERGEARVSWTGPTDFGDSGPRLVVAPTAGSAARDPAATGADRPARLASGRITRSVGSVPILLAGAIVALALAGVAVRRRVGRDAPPDRSADDAPPSEELLTSEERVLALLREREGRVKQAAISDALGWSDARTSQVVGDLRERDAVETRRVGHENVVVLTDESDT